VPRQLLESRPDPLVDPRRVAAQTGTQVAAAGQSAGLQAGRELVALAHLDAGAVVLCDRVESTVEVAPMQVDHCFELVPRAADLLERVGHADELHGDLLAVYL